MVADILRISGQAGGGGGLMACVTAFSTEDPKTQRFVLADARAVVVPASNLRSIVMRGATAAGADMRALG